jgi:hypothetical protein
VRLRDLHFPPMVRIQIGAVENGDMMLLAEAGKELHDKIVAELGPRRTGPVTWVWFGGDRIAGALEGLVAQDIDVDDVRAYLADRPGGCLVVASAPCLQGGVG